MQAPKTSIDKDELDVDRVKDGKLYPTRHSYASEVRLFLRSSIMACLESSSFLETLFNAQP